MVKLISIDKKLRKYLDAFGVDSLDKLSIEEGNKFFVKIIGDFKSGELTLDELSVFGENIFHKIGKKHTKDDIFQASLSASELSFYVRVPEGFKNVSSFLSDVEEFYKKFN